MSLLLVIIIIIKHNSYFIQALVAIWKALLLKLYTACWPHPNLLGMYHIVSCSQTAFLFVWGWEKRVRQLALLFYWGQFVLAAATRS